MQILTTVGQLVVISAILLLWLVKLRGSVHCVNRSIDVYRKSQKSDIVWVAGTCRPSE